MATGKQYWLYFSPSESEFIEAWVKSVDPKNRRKNISQVLSPYILKCIKNELTYEEINKTLLMQIQSDNTKIDAKIELTFELIVAFIASYYAHTPEISEENRQMRNIIGEERLNRFMTGFPKRLKELGSSIPSLVMNYLKEEE